MGAVQVALYTPDPTLTVLEAKFAAWEVLQPCYTDQTPYWHVLDVFFQGTDLAARKIGVTSL